MHINNRDPHCFSEYQLQQLIGNGSFAKVYKIKRKKDDKIFALKEIDFKGITLKDKQGALNQVRILASLRDDNVIGFQSSYFDSCAEKLYIVMEFAENGDLRNKIDFLKLKEQNLDQNDIWKIIFHVSKGLKYLHSQNIIHRDLKAANIFQTYDKVFKIADFNISKLIKSEQNYLTKTQTGTPFYACPEIWQNTYYDYKSDIWSLGIITYQLCTLQFPFPAQHHTQLHKKINQGKFQRIPLKYSDQLSTLISDMLSHQPENRPTSEEIIDRCVFNNVRVNKNIPTKKRKSSLASNQKNIFLETIKLPSNLNDLDGMIPKKSLVIEQNQQENKIINTDLIHKKIGIVESTQQNYPLTKARQRKSFSIRQNFQKKQSKIKNSKNSQIKNQKPTNNQNIFKMQWKDKKLLQNDINLKSNNRILQKLNPLQNNNEILNKGLLIDINNSSIYKKNIQGKLRPIKLPSFILKQNQQQIKLN